MTMSEFVQRYRDESNARQARQEALERMPLPDLVTEALTVLNRRKEALEENQGANNVDVVSRAWQNLQYFNGLVKEPEISTLLRRTKPLRSVDTRIRFRIGSPIRSLSFGRRSHLAIDGYEAFLYSISAGPDLFPLSEANFRRTWWDHKRDRGAVKAIADLNLSQALEKVETVVKGINSQEATKAA